MAVSSAYTFNYEVEVEPREGGGFNGSARSLQEAEGLLPGLAGARPIVNVVGDDLYFEARELPSALSNGLEAVSVLIPPLCNWLVDRRLRQASLRRIELSLAGLGMVLRAGQVIRAALVMGEDGIPANPPRANVSLVVAGCVVRTWEEASAVLVAR